MASYRYASVFPDKSPVYSMKPPAKRHNVTTPYADHFYTSEKEDSSEMFVYSVGHQLSWKGKNISRRVVSSAIIHYVIDGEAIFNGKPVKGGQFFFTLPYQEYSIIHNPTSPLEFYWISLAGPKTIDILKTCGFDEMEPVQNFDFSTQMIDIFDDMIYNDHPKNSTELYLLGACYRLLSFHKAMNLRLEKEKGQNRDYVYFKNAMTFINNNFNKGISASDVAEHLHVSTSYTRLIFRKYCKYSPYEMIMFKRFEQAKSDLEFSDSSIKEIALRAGYHDQSLFSRLFKKMMGESPAEYRTSHRKEKQP